MKKRIVLLIVLFAALELCACSPAMKSEKQAKPVDVAVEEPKEAQDKTQNATITDVPTADRDESASALTLNESRILADQSFDVNLDGWGSVRFVSYEPDSSVEFEDVSFFLVKNKQVVYSFPFYCENNNTQNDMGLYDSVAAVGFRDVNQDGKKDVIAIVNYITGAGPQGMIPRPKARIFTADAQGNEFRLARDWIDDVSEHFAEKDLTINAICEYLKNKSHG